ncbi:DUF3300 domain-containing protein [Rhodanobacter sp. 7MK24]|uniref:DUF3300 domain-containing protein n=1 Tax=Rhodanobacter sp. 7MK24 TaxID=2775922 RepID=UPI0017840B7E|nr:DUF3300 domain-containing protein [Rhodanobacter sp. 7MK24]MBD8881355.1 DUF3300 domain-containing protein [Rhodanobacter sp. 7MK24]
MIDRTFPRNAACTLLCAGVVMLAGCNKAADSQAANPAAAGTAPASAGTSAQQPAPYTPPSADQLYQMVAPIALFPDKLVAQVLAGSTYPDQITAADNMLQQHPNLTGSQLADEVNPQPWDPSVKGLTQFPNVLDQMAQNIPWTTALGEAYVNDPSDVMNAIQVMRQRAQHNGSLRSSAQMQVVSQPSTAPADEQQVAYEGDAQPVYAGPAEVPPPPQTIEILPAQPDTVYVPQYDPETVYGEPMAPYPGYTYAQPAGYSTGQIVATGAIAFGVGIVVGALFEHHHDNQGGPGPNPGWGWNSWGMNWGRHGGGPEGQGGGWQRPAVVHNNTVYVSRSTTVVNRYVTNNINNSRTINNVTNNTRYVNTTNSGNNRYIGNGANNERAPAAAAQKPAMQAMTMPHFGTPVRGAEPARFQQAHAGAPAQPVPHAAEAPRAVEARRATAGSRPFEAPRAAAAPRPVEAPHAVAAPRPAEAPRAAEVVHSVEAPHEAARPEATHTAPPRPEPTHATAPRPVEMERAPQPPAPRPEARPQPAPSPAAHPAPAEQHQAAKPAHAPPKKQDNNQH